MFSFLRNYPYFSGNLLVMVVWLVFYFRRKDLRRGMLVMSLIGAIAGPISEIWYFADYWRPRLLFDLPLGIEDLLFGFTVVGISVTLYEQILNLKWAQKFQERRESPLLFTVVELGSLFVFHNFLNLNSIYASMIGFLIILVIILACRKDLWKDAIVGGFFGAVVAVALYSIHLNLFPYHIEKEWLYISSRFLRIPLTEIVRGITWVAIAGPAFKFWQGLKAVPLCEQS